MEIFSQRHCWIARENLRGIVAERVGDLPFLRCCDFGIFAAAFAQFGPESFVTRYDDGPVIEFYSPITPGGAHTLTQRVIGDDARVSIGNEVGIHVGKLSGAIDITAVAVAAAAVFGSDILSAARQRRDGGNLNALNAVLKRVAIPVPVSDHDGQARGHRLDRS